MKGLSRISGIVSDLDGVFFQGNAIQPGAKEFVDAVRKRGWKITFASNGAGGRARVVKKLGEVGIDLAEDDVMTAGYATAQRLAQDQDRLQEEMRVLFLGPPELKEECARQGVEGLLSQHHVWHPLEKRWIAERDPTHVVTSRHDYTQSTVEAAAAALRRGGKWIATGTDHAVTTETGDLRAGTGTLIAAIRAMLATTDSASSPYALRPRRLSEARPEIMGKPDPRIVQACLDRMRLPAELAAMLGDSFDTDMRVARTLKMVRWLVLSGVTSQTRAIFNKNKVHGIVQNIGDLAEIIGKKA